MNFLPTCNFYLNKRSFLCSQVFDGIGSGFDQFFQAFDYFLLRFQSGFGQKANLLER